MYANKFGCHVTAFSSSAGKEKLIKELGAHEVVSSSDSEALKKEADKLTIDDVDSQTTGMLSHGPAGESIKSGSLSIHFNLLNSLVGLTLLSMPYALSRSGWILGLLILLIVLID